MTFKEWRQSKINEDNSFADVQIPEALGIFNREMHKEGKHKCDGCEWKRDVGTKTVCPFRRCPHHHGWVLDRLLKRT